jgi:hypothetical protein
MRWQTHKALWVPYRPAIIVPGRRRLPDVRQPRRPARCAVARDADSGGVLSGTDTGSTPINSPNVLTVGASASLLIIGIEADTSTPGTITVKWDPAGTAQTMTQVGSTLTVSSGTPASMALFGVVNPTAGLKPVSIALSGQATTVHTYVYGISFTGSATSSVAAATEGFASASGTGTAMSVASAASIPSGDMATSWFDNVQGFTSAFTHGTAQSDGGTAIGKDEALTNNAAAEYYSGSGSTITASATQNASDHWGAMIVGIKAAGGGGGGAFPDATSRLMMGVGI